MSNPISRAVEDEKLQALWTTHVVDTPVQVKNLFFQLASEAMITGHLSATVSVMGDLLLISLGPQTLADGAGEMARAKIDDYYIAFASRDQPTEFISCLKSLLVEDPSVDLLNRDASAGFRGLTCEASHS